MKKILLLSVVSVNLLFGSATIFGGGTKQSISFSSEPENATIYIDGVQRCKTPCTLSLEKGEYQAVTFKKDGYKSKTIPMESGMRGLVLLNILGFSLGLFSTTTDIANGSAYEYSPNQYFIELKKKDD